MNRLPTNSDHCPPTTAHSNPPSSLISHLSSLISHPYLPFFLFFALWLVLMLAGRHAMFRDPGTFWHIVVGDNILSTGTLPCTDSFSFTRDGQSWIADQWLAEIGMAAIYRAAGWDGLLTITAAILAGIYTFIATRLLRAGVHWLITCTIMALVLLAGSHQFHVRPLIFTLAGITITYSLMLDIDAGRKSPHCGWLLVPLFVLWTNLHGGVLLGLAVVIWCSLGWLLEQAMLKKSPLGGIKQPIEIIALLVVLLLSTLINPYGLKLLSSWFKTLSMPLPELIQEHARLYFFSPIGLATLSLTAIYMVILLGTLSQSNKRSFTWLVPLLCVTLAMQRIRNAPLFAITAALALPYMLPYSRPAAWLKRRRWLADPISHAAPISHSERSEESTQDVSAGCHVHACRGHAYTFLTVILLALVLCLQTAKIPLPIIGSGWAGPDSGHWPLELLGELETLNKKTTPPGERIFNDLKFGGFLIYHAPKLKIFIDDRCPLYGTDFLMEYDDARRENPEQIDLWQQQYGFKYALVEPGTPFDSYLQCSGNWTLQGRSGAAVLYRSTL
jgi:hypothetical protein